MRAGNRYAPETAIDADADGLSVPTLEWASCCTHAILL